MFVKVKKIFTLFLFLVFISLNYVIPQAESASSPFLITKNKKDQPIILMKTDYQKSFKINPADFYSDPANLLKCLVLATPNSIYLDKIPERPGGILIYTKEKDTKKIQKDLDKLWSIFSSKQSKEKDAFFSGVLTVKEYSKIIHQEADSFILENSQGKSEIKKLKPLIIDSYKVATNTKPVNKENKQNPYFTASAKDLAVKKVTENSYFLGLLNSEDHKQIRDSSNVWNAGVCVALESRLNQRIYSAIKSPDGKRVAFTTCDSQTYKSSWPQANWNLYIVNTDGNSLKKVTNNTTALGEISFYWSLDSKKIFYHQADSNGQYNLYCTNADGTGNMQLTKGGTCQGSKISPDGKKIAFLISGQNDFCNLWVMTTSGQQSKLLVKNITPELLVWSPDSQKLVYCKLGPVNQTGYKSASLGVVSVNDSQSAKYLTDFTTKNGELEESWLNQSPIIWFNGSKELLYTQDKVNQKGHHSKQIYLLDLATGQTKLFTPKENISYPVVNRDSKTVLFLEQKENGPDYVVWISDSQGKNERPIAQGQSKDFYYTISPDAKKVAFISNNRVWVINTNNSGLNKLFDADNLRVKDGGYIQLKDIQWSADGSRLTCLAQSYHSSYMAGQQPYTSNSLVLSLSVN